MCPPPAARTTSTRSLNSSQTRLSVSSVTDCTAAVIQFVSSSKSVGDGGTQTRSFTYPHIPIRKSYMVSCLGILWAKSVVSSLRVPCVQSNVEAVFHLLMVAFVWALVVESSGNHMKL
jgi:hypothetical protein